LRPCVGARDMIKWERSPDFLRGPLFYPFQKSSILLHIHYFSSSSEILKSNTSLRLWISRFILNSKQQPTVQKYQRRRRPSIKEGPNEGRNITHTLHRSHPDKECVTPTTLHPQQLQILTQPSHPNHLQPLHAVTSSNPPPPQSSQCHQPTPPPSPSSPSPRAPPSPSHNRAASRSPSSPTSPSASTPRTCRATATRRAGASASTALRRRRRRVRLVGRSRKAATVGGGQLRCSEASMCRYH
jgi:hypothetical protein